VPIKGLPGYKIIGVLQGNRSKRGTSSYLDLGTAIPKGLD